MMKKYRFWLILLFWLFWIISFCSADTISDYVKNDLTNSFNYDVSNWTTWTDMFQVNWWTDGGYICFFTDQNYVSNITPTTPNSWPYITFRQSNYSDYNWILYLDMVYPARFLCFELHPTGFSFKIQAQFQYNWYSWVIPIHYFFMNDLLDSNYISSCPSQYTSEECQSEYNLIPISSVDENYCLDNNLCSSSTWNVSRSALYINNIQHLSSPIISVDIPDEISWDYSVENDRFNLDIEGYNVDSDYIDWIINLQKSTPNNQDFNNIITNIIPLLVPGLVIILFIIFIFRFIKKIF